MVLKVETRRFLFNIEHSGPSEARNCGVKQAKGNLLIFTDSDCLPIQDWLEVIVKPLTQQDIIEVKRIYCTKFALGVSHRSPGA